MNHDGHDEREPRRGFVVVVLFVVCMCGASAAQRFRASVDVVQVAVTVTNSNGRLIPGLAKDDFEILEDGIPQRISFFTDQRVPVSLGVLLDASDSMRGQAIADARAAVDRFVTTLLEGGDQAFVAAFNHQPRLIAPWTQPPRTLAGRLDALQPFGGTALYDALVASAVLFSSRAHTRAALIVVSDGVDTASDLPLRQTLDVMRRADPLVYAVAIDAPGAMPSRRVNVDALREVTGASGGYTEVVRGSADLGPATERIANELNTQYTLGYVPSRGPDDTWRGIRVRVKDRNYVTRARRGYYAVR